MLLECDEFFSISYTRYNSLIIIFEDIKYAEMPLTVILDLNITLPPNFTLIQKNRCAFLFSDYSMMLYYNNIDTKY